MRRPSFRLSALPLGVAAGALALAACSDSVVTPTTRAPGAAARSATVNTSSITLASDAASPSPTQFCGGTFGVFTVFPASNPVLPGACGNARDLQADGSLGAYNPGWDNPNGLTVTTGHWVGFTAAAGPSSDYRPTPGLYYYTQSFTLPTGVTAPSLSLDVLGDNVVAVYLNGTKLGQQTMTDCNSPPSPPCNWQITGKLNVTAASGLFNAPGVANTLVFIVNDVPTGFPSSVAGVGGPDPQYGCTTRPFQVHGSTGFPAGQDNVLTSAGHVGPHPTGEATGMVPTPTDNVANPTQDGCENPSGLAFAGTVSFTNPPPSAIWCSPGFWKNHGIDLWVPLQGLAYNTHGPYPNDPQTFVGFDFGKKVGLQNPTLLQVIQNPSIYGGPATNNVASYIALQLFGTPESANPTENCPDVLPLPN
jgi:hypothetical protein